MSEGDGGGGDAVYNPVSRCDMFGEKFPIQCSQQLSYRKW